MASLVPRPSAPRRPQASKQASKHTHASAQCSPASVGLAQARPNKYTEKICIKKSLKTTRLIPRLFLAVVEEGV